MLRKSYIGQQAALLARMGLSASVLLSAGQAIASDARVHVLQSPAGVDDPGLIFMYPALSAGESEVFVELGTPGDSAYGGGLYTTSFGTLGLFVSRDASLMQSIYPVVGNGPDLIARLWAPYQLSRKFLGTLSPLPARPLDIVYGRPLASGALGIRVTFAGDHSFTENGPAKTTASSDQLDLGLGYSGRMGGARFDTGLSVGIIGSVENVTENAGDKQEQNYTRGLSFRLNGRYIRPMNSGLDAVAKAGFAYESPEVEASNAGASQDRDLTEILFDVQTGANIKASSSTTVYTGVTVFYAQSKGPFSFAAPAGGASVPAALAAGQEALTLSLTEGTSEKSLYGLLGSVSLETQVSESWHLLGGMAYPLFGSGSAKDKVTAGNPKYEFRLADVSDGSLWTIGFGYQSGALRVDAVANAKDFLHKGPHFVSGNPSANPLLVAISASYDLGGGKSTASDAPSLPPVPEPIVPPASY